MVYCLEGQAIFQLTPAVVRQTWPPRGRFCFMCLVLRIVPFPFATPVSPRARPRRRCDGGELGELSANLGIYLQPPTVLRHASLQGYHLHHSVGMISQIVVPIVALITSLSPLRGEACVGHRQRVTATLVRGAPCGVARHKQRAVWPGCASQGALAAKMPQPPSARSVGGGGSDGKPIQGSCSAGGWVGGWGYFDFEPMSDGAIIHARFVSPGRSAAAATAGEAWHQPRVSPGGANGDLYARLLN